MLLLLLLLEFFLPTISLPIYTNRKINLVEHSPNQNKKFQTSDGSKIINFFTDKDGFLNYDKPDLSPTAIFFGGSTTENILIDPNLRFTNLIENKLSNECSCQIKVLNGGVSGNNNLNSFLSFISKGIPFKPKYVFLMGSLNDFSQLRSFGSYWNLNNNQSVLHSNKSLTYRLLNFLKVHLFTDIYYNLKSIGFNPNSLTENVELTNKLSLSHEGEKDYFSVIKSFNHVANQFGIDFYFITEPYLNIEPYQKEIDSIHSKLKKISNLKLIDLESLIPKKRSYFIDNTHLSEKGNELASKIIFEVIKNKK